MHLYRIQLKNYKAYNNIEMTFKPGVNLLIGDNGTGKTSLLDGIAVALGGLFTRLEGVPAKNMVKDDVHVTLREAGDASTHFIYCEPVIVECMMEAGGSHFSWKRVKEELSASYTKTDNRDASSWLRELANMAYAPLPLLSYQSATRVWKVKRGDFGNTLSKRLDDRRCGYLGCLDGVMDVKTIQQWCLKQEMVAFQKEQKISEYEGFKQIVTCFMQAIEDLKELPTLHFSKQFNELIYGNGHEELPISKLSAGYQSLLWMVMDLAYRTMLLNPDIKDPKTVEGIVLIDEADMHLHPRWQWNLIDALTRTFPRVQFIVATHSPIILSSAKNAHLIELDENHNVRYLPDSYGYTVGDVLAYRQESISRPRKIDEIINQITDALDDDHITEASEALTELRKKLGEQNTEYKHMQQLIEDTRMILEMDE